VVSSPALRGALHGGRPLNWRSSAIARSGAPGLSSRVAAWWRPARLAIALVLLAVIVSGGTAYRQERHGARLAAVVSTVPTTDIYLSIFGGPEGTDQRLATLDPITLADRPERDAVALGPTQVALSSDGSTMVTVDSPWRNGQPLAKTTVVVRDGATGGERYRFELPGAPSGRPRLSRDGSRHVVTGDADGGGLKMEATTWQVIDTGNGRVIATGPYRIDGEWPSETWIDPEATRLYGLFLPRAQTNTGPGPSRIVARDLRTGAEVGRLVLPDVRSGTWTTDRTVTPEGSTENLPLMAVWVPGVALSPDGATIALSHADEDAITQIDARRLTVERTIRFAPPRTLRDHLLTFFPFMPQPVAAKMAAEGTTLKAVFGADGQHLYLMGRRTTYGDDLTLVIEQLGLRVVNIVDGTEVVSEDTSEWRDLQPSTDGRSLYGFNNFMPDTSRLTLQRLDAETLAVEAEREISGFPRLLLRPSVPDGSDTIE